MNKGKPKIKELGKRKENEKVEEEEKTEIQEEAKTEAKGRKRSIPQEKTLIPQRWQQEKKSVQRKTD